MTERILILGASARAAAASARRAGFEPFAIDLFADADTERICDCLKCPPNEYPHGLYRLARQAPPMPWMYTGGLENYPELVGELAAERELSGTGPEVLRAVRDPFALSHFLAGKGFEHPEPIASGRPLPADRRWLRKPIKGSAGFGIRFATPDESLTAGDGYYFQQFVPGRPMSAAFVGTPAGAEQIGVTAQLVGTPWLHAPPFRYAGNIAAPDASWEARSYSILLGFRLAAVAGVRGPFGIDFILSDGAPSTVEVNPRYTASMEVLEHATRASVLRKPVGLEDSAHPTNTVGKAIYYAPHRITFPASGPWDDSLARAADVWRRPDYADIPHAGDVIERGHPVLTILAEADTEANCLRQLQSRAADLDRLFGVRP